MLSLHLIAHWAARVATPVACVIGAAACAGAPLRPAVATAPPGDVADGAPGGAPAPRVADSGVNVAGGVASIGLRHEPAAQSENAYDDGVAVGARDLPAVDRRAKRALRSGDALVWVRVGDGTSGGAPSYATVHVAANDPSGIVIGLSHSLEIASGHQIFRGRATEAPPDLDGDSKQIDFSFFNESGDRISELYSESDASEYHYGATITATLGPYILLRRTHFVSGLSASVSFEVADVGSPHALSSQDVVGSSVSLEQLAFGVLPAVHPELRRDDAPFFASPGDLDQEQNLFQPYIDRIQRICAGDGTRNIEEGGRDRETRVEPDAELRAHYSDVGRLSFGLRMLPGECDGIVAPSDAWKRVGPSPEMSLREVPELFSKWATMPPGVYAVTRRFPASAIGGFSVIE